MSRALPVLEMMHTPDLMQPLYRLLYHFLHLLVFISEALSRWSMYCKAGMAIFATSVRGSAIHGVAGNFIAWSSSGFLRLPRRPAFLPTFSGGCRGAKYQNAVAPQSLEDFWKPLKAWILWCAKVAVYEFYNWISLVDCVKHVFFFQFLTFPLPSMGLVQLWCAQFHWALAAIWLLHGNLHNSDRAARSHWRKELPFCDRGISAFGHRWKHSLLYILLLAPLGKIHH